MANPKWNAFCMYIVQDFPYILYNLTPGCGLQVFSNDWLMGRVFEELYTLSSLVFDLRYLSKIISDMNGVN